MASNVTYKNLFTLVDEQIKKRVQFRGTDSYGNQLQRPDSVQPFAMSSSLTADISAQELVVAVQNLLENALPSRIISGLAVTATSPESGSVNISAGTGAAGGRLFTLEEDIVLDFPFDTETRLYFINIQNNAVVIDKTQFSNKLPIAKIVVPNPALANEVLDTNDGSGRPYIIQLRTFDLYGNENGQFEEDTRELIKDNIGSILAETIIGTLTLDENLKVKNVQGTLELNSDALKVFNTSGNLLSKFNERGAFFYDINGIEKARFTADDARVGNILVTPNSLESENFLSGIRGFQIKDSGDVEFNELVVRGTVHASAGSIGGFTITPTKLYGGVIQTSENVASGDTGVVMDSSGLRGYDSILGTVFNLPTDGSSPTFASGTISNTIFEINTNAILRTSESVGDGSSNSAGILINDTGLYGLGANQTLSIANLKALVDGSIRLSGEIIATTGQIGNTTITSTKLSGGLIEGSTIRASLIESSSTVPRIRIDVDGIYYQVTTGVGTYGEASSGSSGFQYGDGTLYGAGITAYLFNQNFPTLTIFQEQDLADVRLYNRDADPTQGTHEVGDLIVVSGVLKICTTGGTPGTFTVVGSQS